MTHAPIYHLARSADWAEALRLGTYAGSKEDRHDGFIHFSTAAQVQRSAERHRAGEVDLLLVAVDPEPLGAAIRWEPASNGDLYAHLYGALDPHSVLSAQPLPLGSDGRHVFPPGL